MHNSTNMTNEVMNVFLFLFMLTCLHKLAKRSFVRIWFCVFVYVFIYIRPTPMAISWYPSGLSLTAEQLLITRGNPWCYPKQIFLVSVPVTVGLDTGKPKDIRSIANVTFPNQISENQWQYNYMHNYGKNNCLSIFYFFFVFSVRLIN